VRRVEDWRPTKIERSGATFRVRPEGIGPGSLLMALAMTESLLPCLSALSGRIADLGAGHVPFYEAYASAVREVVCVDWSNSLHGVTHADVIADLGRPLPFAAASFDGVLFSSVLEHLADPAAALAEAARILRPGGALVLEVPFLYWLHEEPHDFGRYTEHALRRFADIAGFDVNRLEAYGGIAAVIGDVTAKGLNLCAGRAHNWLPERAGVLLARSIATASRWGQKCLFDCFVSSARRASAPDSARKFPLGYVAVLRKRQSAPAHRNGSSSGTLSIPTRGNRETESQ
jgi:SAM-dependent methyltransferase